MEPTVSFPGRETPDSRFTQLADRLHSGLASHLGIKLIEARHGHLTAQIAVADHHMAANGYLHAGAIVALADTACGFGCFASLPDGAQSFTTVELKSNFLRTVGPGAVIRAEARLVHGGRRTQVWDATVYTLDQKSGEHKPLALFRCTQMLIYGEPRPSTD
jgi:uncharacterized protein (TIGR00369 family)